MSILKNEDEEVSKIIVGSTVLISNLQKASYFIYRQYLNYSPLLICPCKVKRNIPLKVEDIFENGIHLLSNNKLKIITMTYRGDLELIG